MSRTVSYGIAARPCLYGTAYSRAHKMGDLPVTGKLASGRGLALHGPRTESENASFC